MDYELIFWIAVAIAGWIAFCVLRFLAKKEAENYVEWMRDWE